MPMDVYLMEADELAGLIAEAEVAAKLDAVGVSSDERGAFRTAVVACREAQTAWLLVRSGFKDEDLAAAEDEARRLRRDMVSALRFHLADDAGVQRAVDRVQVGQRRADLVEDLLVVAALVESHAGAFEADRTFDQSELPAQARAVANRLRTALASRDRAGQMRAAVDTRDRAFTLLDSRLKRLRAAGRHAFRGEPDRLPSFGSAYGRRMRRVSRRESSGSDSAN